MNWSQMKWSQMNGLKLMVSNELVSVVMEPFCLIFLDGCNIRKVVNKVFSLHGSPLSQEHMNLATAI